MTSTHSRPRGSGASNATASSLSTREREIVALVAQGLPNKQIAAALNISQWTVGSHLRVLYAKFGVTSRAALVASVLTDETSR
jgi:DNA-binding CsgD family transcriptional regulator